MGIFKKYIYKTSFQNNAGLDEEFDLQEIFKAIIGDKMFVTVILPAYNAEKYISETLDCMLNQTYKNIEVLCINDGSIDNTENIIKEYVKKDSRVRLYTQENKGLPATRNIGIEMAKGELITFIDADDTCSLNTIETSVRLFEENNCE